MIIRGVRSRAWPGEGVGRGYQPTPKKLPFKEREGEKRGTIYGELIPDGFHLVSTRVWKPAFLTDGDAPKSPEFSFPASVLYRHEEPIDMKNRAAINSNASGDKIINA